MDDKTTLIKHSVKGISDSYKHGSHLVKVFEDRVLQTVKHNTNIISVNQCTDGYAAQYKGNLGIAY